MVLTRQITPKEESRNPLKPLSLVSMRKFERRLGLPRATLQEIAEQCDSYYMPRADEKPLQPFAHVKKNPKIRLLDCPQGPLKEVQRRIYRTLLRDLELPEYLCGGVKGHSVLDNVALHAGESLIVTIDIKSWFPSITSNDVHFVWYTVLKCSREIADLLTSLTTFNGHLPQGSPASMALSNLVLYSIDLPIRRAAASLGVNYSCWVDDLVFSGENARRMIPVVKSTLKVAGFKISQPKLKVMGTTKQKVINGIIPGRKPSIPKQTRERIRSALHHLRVKNICEQVPMGKLLVQDVERYIATQKGKLAYFRNVNPQQTRLLEEELLLLQQKTN